MKLVGKLLGACLAAALVTLAPQVEPLVSAQPQSGVAGERTPARRGTYESTASIMLREDDLGARPPAANLTVQPGAPLLFDAIRFSDTSVLPPDGSAAAGPTQLIAIANGWIRTLTKNGGADGVMNFKPDTFFAAVRGGGSTFGGRIRFDRASGRWFIIMATTSVPGRIVIASSSTATITAATIWSFSSFDDTFLTSDCTTDRPSLGIDASALYIGANQFCTGGTVYRGSSAWVVRKSSVLDGATPVVTAFHDLTGGVAGPGPFAPQGVTNDDAAPATGYFLGVDNASFGVLTLRRVSNPGATPTLSANISIPVAATSLPLPVRHLGNTGGANGYLAANDDRLGSVTVRNGRAWVAHTIAVTDAGSASAATRDGVRWYELGSLDTTPVVVQSGTLNDPAAAGSVDERNYFNASIATNVAGRTVVGFSVAGTREYVQTGAADRFAGDAAGSFRATGFMAGGSAAYNPPADPGSAAGRRWGGYSETTLDGCDGTTIWSLQQYVDVSNSYALRAIKVQADPPPGLSAAAPQTILPGLASVDVVITGSSSPGHAFFDAPAGFACRLSASIPGVTVNSVALTSPTTVTVNVSTVSAAPGLKSVTIINPDGQASTGSLLTVAAGPAMSIENPLAGTAGQPLIVRGWALDNSATSGSGVDIVQVYATPAGGAAVLLGTATYGLARTDVAQLFGAQFVNSGFSLRATSTLTPGPYTITVYSHSTVTGAFYARQVAVTLSGPVAPFGVMDTPAANATVAGEMAVTGWALDDGGIQSVDVYRANIAPEPLGLVLLGHATFVKGARPDLQALYPSYPDSDSAGWGLLVLTNMLPNAGNGPYTLYAYATDYAGLSTLIGTRQVTGANSASTLPFGTIDTPGQGATVSGTIVNFGWALTPQPKMIPIDGSTIEVYVDGVFLGHPTYNQFRSDLASVFPGLKNTGGAAAFFIIDTRTLTDGLHTIGWIIRDDAGKGAGVGSRFFRVQNGS
jgi:Bacterial Ig domain